MKKVKRKLICCPICNLPQILYECVFDEKTKNLSEAPEHQVQGPNAQPHIKTFCTGLCESLTIPLALEVDALLSLAKRTKGGVRKLARAAARRLDKLIDGQKKELLWEAERRGR